MIRCMVILTCLLWVSRASAAILFHNGSIVTMNPEQPLAEAVAVEGDRIVAVGGSNAVRAAAGAAAQNVDLNGAAMLPGFIDAHGHFPASGLIGSKYYLDLNSPPIGSMRNLNDILEALQARVRDTPEGQWIRGGGYDDTLLAERRHPTRADLDRVSTRHPIYLSHISGHLAVANSLALKRAGIDKDTPQPAGGRFRKDPKTREPNGVMEESPAFGRVSRLLPEPSAEDMLAAIERAAYEYASVGVTTAQTGAANPTSLKQTVAAWEAGRLPIRVQIWPVMDVMLTVLHNPDKMAPPAGQNRVAVGALKGFADGSIQGYTGYLSKPYFVPPAEDPDYRGYPLMEPEQLAARVTRLHAAGFQLAIHGNGDAAIDDILDAFEKAQQGQPRPDARHILIHAQMAREDQLDRMQSLGVIPSFFNLHTYYWGDRHRDIFMGPARAARMSPARSAVRRGMRFTLHADTPVVPMQSMMVVWAAVNRLTTSGKVIGAEQRISVFDALKAITVDAAWQGFEEDLKGTIEPGKLADLVVLDRNPLQVPDADLKDLRVLQTFVGGRRVYTRTP